MGLKPKSRFEAHSRWKLAYIALLVAMELLLKEAIYRVHPNLIYVDVDSPQTTGDLLVTFRQAIARGKSLTGLSLTEREWQFLLNCTHERTDLLHCKTAIGLDKIPEKYRKLHAIYRRIHKQLTGYDLEGVLEAHRQNAEGYRYCVNCQGERHERIKYGDEPKISSDLSEEELWMKVLNPFFKRRAVVVVLQEASTILMGAGLRPVHSAVMKSPPVIVLSTWNDGERDAASISRAGNLVEFFG